MILVIRACGKTSESHAYLPSSLLLLLKNEVSGQKQCYLDKTFSKSTDDVAGGRMAGRACKPVARMNKCRFQGGLINPTSIMKGIDVNNLPPDGRLVLSRSGTILKAQSHSGPLALSCGEET